MPPKSAGQWDVCIKYLSHAIANAAFDASFVQIGFTPNGVFHYLFVQICQASAHLYGHWFQSHPAVFAQDFTAF